MDLKDKAKSYIKNKAKKKVKRAFKILLKKLMIPYGIFFIGAGLVVVVVLTMFQSFSEGSFDVDLSKKDNEALKVYMESKVNEVNNFPTDYFGFDQEHRIKYQQISSFTSYKNTYTESLAKDSSELLRYYKELVNGVVNDLKPKLEYNNNNITTKKKYSTWIKKWKKFNGITNSSGKSLNYIITDDVYSLDLNKYQMGTKIYNYINNKTYEVYETESNTIKRINRRSIIRPPYDDIITDPTPTPVPTPDPKPNPKEKRVKYIEDKPNELKNIIFIKDSSYIPELESLSVGSVVYIYSEKSTKIVEEALKEKQQDTTENISLLINASTFINDYKYTYKMETTTMTTIPDGTEEGRIDGDITVTITKPVLEKKEKLNEDYEKLKQIISKINKDEDMEFVIAMMKNADDTKYNWVFGDSSFNGSFPTSLAGNDIPQEYMEYFIKAGELVGLPPGLIAAFAKIESSFSPNAVNVTSFGSAHGMMQLWEPDWEYYYAKPDLRQFLEQNGFKTQSAKQAWELFKSSPKMQIYIGAWEINYYMNYSLYYHNMVSSVKFNVNNMALIDWNNIFKDKKAYDIAGRGMAIYNGGPTGAKDIDIYGSNEIATYVKKVMKEFEKYSQNSSIVEIAMKYLGFPYLWGGYDPSQGGMDCSGFMQHIHKQIGIDITRTTYTQVEYSGFIDIPASNIKAGDILYYSYNGATVEHVGMYIGNGQFIHASGDEQDTTISIAKSRGHEIKISEYNSYWKSVTHSIKRLK